MHFQINVGIRRVAALVGAGLLLTACGYEGYASSANASTGHVPSVVVVRDHPHLGKILTDSVGATVYVTDQEADGVTHCTQDCLKLWTPIIIPKNAPARAKVDGLGTVNRSDNGLNQVTYKGKPLYTFTLDSRAGDTAGLDARSDFDGTHFVWHPVVLDETPNGQGGFGL